MAAAVSVNLEPGQLSSPIKSGREVKRYIHCSDGVYEEFSSDEEGVYPVPVGTSLVDPVSLTFFYKTQMPINQFYVICFVYFPRKL